MCKIYYPELFPIKFVYGDTIEKYNWMLLYLNFLNKCHTYDIIKAYMIYNKLKPDDGSHINYEGNLSISLEMIIFLVSYWQNTMYLPKCWRYIGYIIYWC